MDWTSIVDNLEKIAGIVAVIVGGLWVYSNSFRGRTFIPRLQVELSGEVFRGGEIQYLLVKMQVKNVGSSIVKLREKGTGLKVVFLCGEAGVDEAINLIEKETTAFPVLESTLKKIRKIEPSTAVNEEKLVVVPTEKYDAFKLELMVYAYGGRIFWFKLPDRYWRAIAIASKHRVTKQAEEPLMLKEKLS